MEENLEKIDHSAIKVSQVIVVALNILAFVLNAPWLAVVVTVILQHTNLRCMQNRAASCNPACRPAGGQRGAGAGDRCFTAA